VDRSNSSEDSDSRFLYIHTVNASMIVESKLNGSDLNAIF